MTRREREVLDAVIVGGGVVGMVCAGALHRAGLKVALVKGPQRIALNANLDTRVYALAPDSLAALDAMGASLLRSFPYQAMRVWAHQQPERALEFSAQEQGWATLGSIVEHQHVLAALETAIEPNLSKFWIQESLLDWRISEDLPNTLCVQTASHSLRARYLIAADGAHSAIRTQAGIATKTLGADEHAIVATLTCTRAHQSTALQHFHDDAVIALLPLSDRQVSLVYSTNSVRAQMLMQQPDAIFLSTLQGHFGSALGELTDVQNRTLVPLQRALAQDYVRGQVVLIGDAAHSVHPLAGLGLNMGIRDVLCLAKHWHEGAHAESALRRYASERKSENVITAQALEALRGIFRRPDGPLGLASTMGLGLFNRMAPLKRLLCELATGQRAGWPAAGSSL